MFNCFKYSNVLRQIPAFSDKLSFTRKKRNPLVHLHMRCVESTEKPFTVNVKFMNSSIMRVCVCVCDSEKRERERERRMESE